MPIQFYGASESAADTWNGIETITGQKTFSDTIVGDISSNNASYFTDICDNRIYSNPDAGQALIIDSSLIITGGNVGIGTTNPTHELEVGGDISATAGNFYIQDISARNIYFTGDVSGHDASFQSLNVGKLDISNNNISTNVSAEINIRTTHDQAIRFYTNDDERMRIKGNGNVGIGTESPTTKLEVKGDGGVFRLQGAGGGGTGHAYMSFFPYDGGGQVQVGFRDPSGGINGRFQFWNGAGTGSTRCFQFLANVGIGSTTTPSQKLVVNGNIEASGAVNGGSDDRIKYNETELTSALDTINKLKPRKYEKITEQPQHTSGIWIPIDAEWDNVKDNWVWDYEIGFIAQDVRNDISDLSFCVEGEELDASGNQTILTLNYNNIFTLSIAALQEVDR